MRKLRVTLDIDVADLPRKKRRALAQGMCFDEGDTPEKIAREYFPRVRELEAAEVARVTELLALDYVQSEMWGGTDIYAKFKKASVVSSEWLD